MPDREPYAEVNSRRVRPIIPLYSGKSFEIPLLMNRQTTWRELRSEEVNNAKFNIKKNKEKLTIELLTRSHLSLFSDKRDFVDYGIDLKHFLKDTIQITFADSAYLYFSIPTPEEFMNESLFNKQHPAKFLIQRNKE